MTYTHPAWNEQDVDRARLALRRLAPTREARAALAPTERERAWLGAVEILYGEGTKVQRDTLYSAAMRTLAERYPADDGAQTFYALSLLGLNQGVRNVPTYMEAGAIALRVLSRNPRHPGAAHYAIHAFDDPVHAVLGLDAARAYAAIAPGAAHAQHMTTHIFLARGMWPEVVAQNRTALGGDQRYYNANHYTYWLHYGLLQEGQTHAAAALLDTLRWNQDDSAEPAHRAQLAQARAQQVMTGERWADPALAWHIALTNTDPVSQAADAFARAYAALMRGDSGAAATAGAELRDVAARPGVDSVASLMATEFRAVRMRASGDTATAERALRAVAEASSALPASFGPPDLVKPPYELLGEWYLTDGRKPEAHQAFVRALELMPGRLLSLRGLKASS
jgi:hypothetical protein